MCLSVHEKVTCTGEKNSIKMAGMPVQKLGMKTKSRSEGYPVLCQANTKVCVVLIKAAFSCLTETFSSFQKISNLFFNNIWVFAKRLLKYSRGSCPHRSSA